MAGYLALSKRSARACVAVLAWLAFHPLQLAAEVIRDPTRPPSARAVGDAIPASLLSDPVLQSVLISNGRRIASINGESFSEGDKVGDARVVRIVENEVTLRVGKQLQTLKVFPDVDKRAAVSRHNGLVGQR